jgi:ketosteroid isomerase-like protein
MILALLLVAGATAPEFDFKAQDQALEDAVSAGDAKVWDNLLASDAQYLDENGVLYDRAGLLKEIVPLPPGISGEIYVRDHQAHVHGDHATVLYRAEEHEHFHGQELLANYLATETWRKENGKWKLALVHNYATNKDPQAIALPAEKLEVYAGRYEAGPDFRYVIQREGDHLIGGREGKPPKPLSVELLDVLFSPGQPRSRKIFQRNSAGQITGYFDRREGVDIVWKKL